jgi:carbamoyl-phosphate synthase large subunit
MARIQIGGAGGAPSNNVIRSLREADAHSDVLIGMSSFPPDLFLADVDERYSVPPAASSSYPAALLTLIESCRPDFLHVQNDIEVLAVSRLRDEIERRNVRLMLPSPATIELCVDKARSCLVWRENNVPTPRTLQLNSPTDLEFAFAELGPTIWIRANVGGGGRGALPTSDHDFARGWIDRFEGWGNFSAAELLTDRSFAWLSIWYRGDLIVAQGRSRLAWRFGDRALSGVTGVTAVGETASLAEADRLALRAIAAVDDAPHGIFGVDMAYAEDNSLRVTEINIGRFFTTVYFFTAAGLNMPRIYRDLALEGKRPELERVLNPLPDGLVWIRGMDVQPVLVTAQELASLGVRLT